MTLASSADPSVLVYRGLTWDHPRGYNALAAASVVGKSSLAGRGRAAIDLDWEKQPLEGFEAHPIADLAARYDLIVLDHPHVGEAVQDGCLVPLESLLSRAELAMLGGDTVGPCLSSYQYGGKTWALPLDAATQVMAVGESWREHAPPATWDEVLAWAGKWPTALSLAGPHAALTFMSICVALGEPPASEDPNVFVSAVTGSTALSIMDRLARPSAAWTRTLNPIGLLEAMASGAELSLVPLVYGYVNYAASGPNGRKRVTFHDAPAARRGGRPGTTLGGTGLAVTRRCKVTPALIDHLRWLMSDGVQERFIPDHDGQPSRRSAWRDADVNRAWGNFYRNTERTLEAAWVRPRHRGYIAFQATASAMIREWLEAAPSSPGALLVRLQSAYAESRRGAGGI